MKGVQCYELFGGIALKIHTFFFHFQVHIEFQYKINYIFIFHKIHYISQVDRKNVEVEISNL